MSRPAPGVEYFNGLGGGFRNIGPKQIVTVANLAAIRVAPWSDAEFKRALTEGISRAVARVGE